MTSQFGEPEHEESLNRESVEIISSRKSSPREHTRKSTASLHIERHRRVRKNRRHSLQSLVASLHDFVLLARVDGTIYTFWSSNSATDESAFLGNKLADVLEPSALDWIATSFAKAAKTSREENCELCAELNDGPHWFWLRVARMFSISPNSRALCLSARDITAQKKMFVDVQRNEAIMAEAQQLAEMGSWEYYPAQEAFSWSPVLSRLLGVKPDAPVMSMNRMQRLIHPEDFPGAKRDLRSLIEHGVPLDNELRFIRADGGVCIIHSRAIVIRDDSGLLVRVSGMGQDVTRQRDAEWRLARNQALLAEGEQIANFGTWEYDIQSGKATLLSDQFLKLTGFSREDWRPEACWGKKLARFLTQGKPFESTLRYRMPDGQMRVHLVRALPVLASDDSPKRIIGILQDITEQTRNEEELSRLSQKLMHTRDQDRREMARELHESVGQTLAGMKMALGQVRDALPEDALGALAAVESARELAEAAVREVRTISYLMHPPMLDEAGLFPALRWYIRGFAERSGIATTMDIPEDLVRLPEEAEIVVFRVIQEALTNVHRYSGSQTAAVRVEAHNGTVHVEVRDEGCGLTPSPSANSPAIAGVGIASMRERVKLLDGTFELITEPGKGTMVRALIPVRQEARVNVIDM